MPVAQDVHDLRFGMLVVKERIPKTRPCRVRCLCDCGKEHITNLESLRAGFTKSCGCYRDAFLKAGTQTTHGMSKGRTYRIWRHMRNRCNLKSHPRYAEWGGRGITVCDRWHTFENFYADMGEALPGTSIDRIDNSKGYYKENCRWVDNYIQAQNKSWSDKTGIRKLRGRYQIKFQLNGKKYYSLIHFDSDQEAIEYRRIWRQEILKQSVVAKNA